MEIKNSQNIDKTPNASFKNNVKGAPVDKMKEFINSFINRAEFELSDIGWFREISDFYLNENPLRYIHKAGLEILPENNSQSSKKRILKAFVTNESDRYATSQTLKEGTREEILNFLKSDDFKNCFDDYVTGCSDNFFMDEKL